MKIVKKGKAPEEVVKGWEAKRGKRGYYKKVKCADSKIPVMGRKEGCGAELEISENDLELLYWEGTHFTHYYAAFKCPVCGKMNSANGTRDETFEKMKKECEAKFDGFSNSIW